MRAASVLIMLCGLMWATIASNSADENASTDTASPASTARQYSHKGADTCLLCHSSAPTLGVFATVHGDPDHPGTPFGDGQLQCEACHGPSAAHATTGDPEGLGVRFDQRAVGADASEPCLECHAQTVALAWHDSTHDEEGVTCTNCHRSHTADRASHDAKDAQCTACHKRQSAAARRLYSHAGTVGCIDCHGAHGGSGEYALRHATLNETCYACHAAQRGPFLWEHQPASDDCSTCHDAHGSNQPAMLNRRGPFLCQSCHARAGHPSVAPVGRAQSAGRSALSLNNCVNCHSQIHGSNHPSGSALTR